MQKQLFPALAVTATALASLLTFAEEMPATVTVEAEHVITADADNKRNSEGDFVRLNDGRILFAYSRFRGGSCDDFTKGDIAVVESRDEGTTWSAPRILFKCPEDHTNYMSVSLLRLKDGRLAAFFADKPNARECLPMIAYSSDEAKTWTEPRLCVTDERGYYVLNNSRILELADGTLLMPVGKHGIKANGDIEWCSRIFCYKSTDAGLTWRRTGEVANLKKAVYQEPGLAALADGRVLIYIRTESKCQYLALSRDKGETWEAGHPSHFASSLSPMKIIPRAGTKEMFAIWNENPAPTSTFDRSPLTLALIDQNLNFLKKWTVEPRRAATGPLMQYAYPALLELGDGRLLAAYFYTPGDKVTIKIRRIKPDCPPVKTTPCGW